MRFIDSSVEIIEQEPGILGVYKQIERAARLSYKSEDRITEDSAKKMVDTLVKNKHLACLEHGTIYLEVPMNQLGARINSKYVSNKYSTSRNSFDCYTFCITTNARVLVENGWLDDLQYMFNPTEYHKKRISVKFTTSIGITRELIRHRAFSFMNESTRYCNYSKGKFNSELTFIIPRWIYDLQAEEASYPNPCDHSSQAWLMNEHGEDLIKDLICMDRTASSWWECLKRIEEDYNYLTTTDEGYQLKAQEARGILPMDTKSEIIMTGFVDDWLHFFALRSYIAATGKPHPDIQKLADELLQEFLDRGYITDKDIKKLEDEKRKQTDKNN
jgi:thymidylate synthase (FAD)